MPDQTKPRTNRYESELQNARKCVSIWVTRYTYEIHPLRELTFAVEAFYEKTTSGKTGLFPFWAFQSRCLPTFLTAFHNFLYGRNTFVGGGKRSCYVYIGVIACCGREKDLYISRSFVCLYTHTRGYAYPRRDWILKCNNCKTNIS